MAANKFTDAVGNNNTAATQFNWTYDNVAPTMTITAVQEGHSGDRVCIDLLSMLEEGEGMLVGSTARSYVLIHGETIQSKYVPTRPFRINAGSVEAYTILADGSTKYLCELKSGDEILIVGSDGATRAATVGRMKIEYLSLIHI